MTPRAGWAPRNQRVHGQAPRNHGQNSTLLAALTLDGIRAALVVEGAANGDVFETYISQVLAPILRPGQLVIWDNLSVHKRPEAREAVEARDCQVVFLPPYSPDFNPIEQAFSKLKTALRRAKQRTRDGLWDAIGEALNAVTSSDATGWFTHCGYLTENDQSL
jgi:transposase